MAALLGAQAIACGDLGSTEPPLSEASQSTDQPKQSAVRAEEIQSSQQALLGPSTVNPSFSLRIPSDVPLQSLALVGDTVSLGANAVVSGPNNQGHAQVAALGSATLSLPVLTAGQRAEVGAVTASKNVYLDRNSHVFGRVVAGGTVSRASGSVVDSAVLERQTIATRTITRSATFSVPTLPQIVTPIPGISTPVNVAPGHYSLITAALNNRIVFRAGDYYVESLQVLIGGHVIIDDSQGPVKIWVKSSFRFDGDVANQAGSFPEWSVYALQSLLLSVNGPFRGTLVAPNATLKLGLPIIGQTHEGAFFGKSVELASNSRVVHRALPWAIRSIAVTPTQGCSGESFRVSVTTEAATSGGPAPSVMINGVKTNTLYEQLQGNPGKRLVAVTARAADGTIESRFATVTINDCGANPPVRPRMIAEPDLFVPGSANFVVANANAFEDASTIYEWSFDDGSAPIQTNTPTARHQFATASNGAESSTYHVKVNVKRAGVPDSSAQSTFVVVDDYIFSKRRGVLEPPSVVDNPVLALNSGSYTGAFRMRNREPSALTISQQRVDQHPCDVDAPAVVGTPTAVSFSAPAGTEVTRQVQVAASALQSAVCSVTIHYWGTTAANQKAQLSVHFDLPSSLESAPVAPKTAELLHYLVQNNLVADPQLITDAEIVRLYQDRKIRYSLQDQVFYQSAQPPDGARGWCDPVSPGAAPESGYTCQPTGGWRVESGALAQAYAANALKGDAILVRSCTGEIAPLLGALDPPQYYTHTGIMTRDRVEIRQSTGDIGYLMQHPNGTAGQPTDGFEEDALRYLWPGTVTVSVQEGFGDGRLYKTPDDEDRKARGFTADDASCNDQHVIIYPRVMKPAPEFERVVRPDLHRAADEAKNINGHYRFFSYSSAPATPQVDPQAPDPILGADGRPATFGGSPTVCSSFVRFAAKAANLRLDTNKMLPLPSDVTRNPPDGIFYYTPEERLAAGHKLYSSLYNTVQIKLAIMEAEADDYWWAGALATVAPLTGLPLSEVGGLGWFATIGAAEASTAIHWSTDAPDDVASQVTNCFALDKCATDDKDSTAWKDDTGWGHAVSPDDMINHFDPPVVDANGANTGGVYGYHERLVYRGKRYRPQFAWLPSPGTRTITGTVVDNVNGSEVAVANAVVEVVGQADKQTTTDASGNFTIPAVFSGNLTIHAQKLFSPPEPGELREGRSCFTPQVVSDATSPLDQVSCDDFSQVVQTGVSQLKVVLQPPPDQFRHVTLRGSVVASDCDCCGPLWQDSCFRDRTYDLVESCDVGPIEKTDTIDISRERMCSDEVGVSLHVDCEWVPPNLVKVKVLFNLYEEEEDSCGVGSGSEDHYSAEHYIQAGSDTDDFRGPKSGSVIDVDGCPSPCDNSGSFSYTFRNERAL